MGKGRKTQTYFPPKEKAEASRASNISVSARNLPKGDLSAVIFGCKNMTIQECMRKELFGLPYGHISYVKNVTDGMTLFLFNYTDRKLHGIFEAVGQGKLNIDPYGWTTDGEEYTPYPAQVRMRARQLCSPLSEDEFRPIIEDNYYNHQHSFFWFELNRKQTGKLVNRFLSSPLAPAPKFAPPLSNRSNWNTTLSTVHSSESKGVGNSSNMAFEANIVNALPQDMLQATGGPLVAHQVETNAHHSQRTWSSLFKETKQEPLVQDSKKIQDTDRNAFAAEEWSWEIEGNAVAFPTTESQHADEWLRESEGNAAAFPNTELQQDDEWSGESEGNDEWGLGETEGNAAAFPTTESQLVDEWGLGETEGNAAAFPTTESQLVDEWGLGETEGNAAAFPTTESQLVDEWGLGETEGNAAAFPTTESQLVDEWWLGETEGNGAEFPSTELQQTDEWSKETEINADTAALPTTELQTSGVHPDYCNLDGGACSGEAQGRANGLSTSDVQLSDIQLLLVKLMNDVGYLKGHHPKQDFKSHCLQHELAEAKLEILRLRNQYNAMVSKSDSSSVVHFEEEIFTPVLDSDDCILVVGGNDGSSWLKDFSCYSPSRNLVKHLPPMTLARTNTSAAKACGELFVLGGKQGDVWSDIVESYNPASDEWFRQPSLNQRKGSLASVSILEKVYAIGGGNEKGCLSDVEMLDLSIGKWIISKPMQHKRFDPAVANINGTLYVVGGYGGKDYLKSVERFDTREEKWTLTGSMNSKRACHCVIALNEKIYALGGFNGTQMVPSVEMFDPRTGSWMMKESMHVERGYFGTVALGEKIYVIGGMKDGNDILESTECYKEGQGWEFTGSSVLGKRCFFSALTL